MLAAFALGFIAHELFLHCIATNRDSHQGIRSGVLAGLQKAVPLTLGLTFLLVPSVSTRVFRSFGDHEMRRYLFADLSLSCDSEEYDATRTTSLAMLVVWPVGTPLLYSALLWVSHSALRAGTSTPLRMSRATALFSPMISVEALWWEPVEMCRKLVLCG
eukprot:5042788-Prymnesium_polylepis.1